MTTSVSSCGAKSLGRSIKARFTFKPPRMCSCSAARRVSISPESTSRRWGWAKICRRFKRVLSCICSDCSKEAGLALAAVLLLVAVLVVLSGALPHCTWPLMWALPPSILPPSSKPVWLGVPCRENSSISMRWPVKRVRSLPWLKAKPSTMERTPRSRALRLPCRRGVCRVPLKRRSASSVPRSRQPGGANRFHMPTRGICACRLPCRGAVAGSVQPLAVRASWVPRLAWALPALALSQSSVACSCVPWLCKARRAVRTPAGMRPRLRGTAWLVGLLGALFGALPSPVSTIRSPLLRCRLASMCSCWLSCTFHAPDKSMSPESTLVCAARWLMALAQSRGMSCSWPWLLIW